MLQGTDKKKIDQLVNELKKAFPNFNVIFVMWENGSGAVEIISNLSTTEANNALKEIGGHIRIVDQQNDRLRRLK